MHPSHIAEQEEIMVHLRLLLPNALFQSWICKLQYCDAPDTPPNLKTLHWLQLNDVQLSQRHRVLEEQVRK